MAALAGVYLLLLSVRLALAWRYARRAASPPSGHPSAAILQPILSGDPALESWLAANARALGAEHLYWLVDDDDPPGQTAARNAATPNVAILTGPGPRDGENPKVAKLDRAFSAIAESIVVVLDDDTRIDATALQSLKSALNHADLVTGLPVFASRGSVFERFIGGFVNGNAVLTYLPSAAVGAQHTINGMIYAARSEELRALGGFAAIRTELTDDYAMARLYESNGKRILQTAVCVDVGMTIRDASHCARVLRRWFLFANRYMRRNASPALIILVAVPTVLPLLGLPFGWPWIAVLFGKALANRLLLWQISRRASSPLDLCFEVLADILSPLFYLSSLFRPQRLSWRSRQIAMDGERIRYR